MAEYNKDYTSFQEMNNYFNSVHLWYSAWPKAFRYFVSINTSDREFQSTASTNLCC